MFGFFHRIAFALAIIAASTPSSTDAFTPTRSSRVLNCKSVQTTSPLVLSLADDNNDPLAEKFGGFTAKQRLREEVESPFRKVRLVFFGSSAGSAFIAFYFSALTAFKSFAGGYSDVPPLNDALVQVAINSGGVIVFGLLAARELKVGKANLERIAKGGMLARLNVEPIGEGSKKIPLADYRRASRVIIAAGGADYINRLAMSLCSDQLKDENNLPEALASVDIVVIPVLINDDYKVVDVKSAWRNAVPGEGDRNFDSSRADEIIALPTGLGLWNEYLDSDISTAQGQGFDVLSKGITITVKKNGRILRRATGLPPYGDYVGVMEVADGSKFGMPGDSEKYGGP